MLITDSKSTFDSMLLGGGLAKEYSSYAFINVDNFLRSQYNPTRFPHLYIFYQNFSPRFFFTGIFFTAMFLPLFFFRVFFPYFFHRNFVPPRVLRRHRRARVVDGRRTAAQRPCAAAQRRRDVAQRRRGAAVLHPSAGGRRAACPDPEPHPRPEAVAEEAGAAGRHVLAVVCLVGRSVFVRTGRRRRAEPEDEHQTAEEGGVCRRRRCSYSCSRCFSLAADSGREGLRGGGGLSCQR